MGRSPGGAGEALPASWRRDGRGSSRAAFRSVPGSPGGSPSLGGEVLLFALLYFVSSVKLIGSVDPRCAEGDRHVPDQAADPAEARRLAADEGLKRELEVESSRRLRRLWPAEP